LYLSKRIEKEEPKVQKMNDTLSLSQEIYLLSVHPKKGGIIVSANSAMNYILVGALFLELFIDNKIEFDNKKIILKNDKSSNHLHQYLLDKFKKSKKELKISTWVNKLAFSMKFIRNEIQKELVEKRVIRMVQKQFLFIRWESPEITNFQLLYKLLSKIESQVIKGTSKADDLLLLSFIKPAGLIRRIFPDSEKRKNAKARLNALLNKNQLSIAANNSIAVAQAVLLSAGIINVEN
jgi:hypothetical protein